MKLKYYLRGLGIGIVVSVILLWTAFGNQKPMTDAEVIARAKELGMIENTVLSEVAEKNEDSFKEDSINDKAEDTSKEENVSEDIDEEIPEESVEEDINEEILEEDIVKEETPESVSIIVERGDSSWSVSKKMEEAGLIDSAKAFDEYLCKNGYDKRISVGTYQISNTATDEEKAKIITKTN